MSLEGRVAAITGASAGIGLACAERFARAGMPVVLGARREDKLAEVVDRIASTGGRATALACDVANEADVTRLVAHAMASFGFRSCAASSSTSSRTLSMPPDPKDWLA